MTDPDPIVRKVAALISNWSAFECEPEECLPHAAAVVAAVTPLIEQQTRERVLRDHPSLLDYLLELNYGRGLEPSLAGYDSTGRPIMVWLTEVGGDEVAPAAAVLGGPVAETPTVEQFDSLRDLSYPVTLSLNPKARS